MEKIDAVITWVDGDDPVLKAKRYKYGDASIFKEEDIAGETRYKTVGEICWCIASINRFAPWVNKIWIVTDGQNPHVDEFLQENFPEGHIPYEIVDHKVIFRGYEQYLPTFNSISIETMTWRIPGLSDSFLVFCDDFMISAPVTPEDFRTADGKVVVYGKLYSMLWKKLKIRMGKKLDMFNSYLFNASVLAGDGRTYLRIDHTPRLMSRVWFEDFFSRNEALIVRNIRHRFRDFDQYAPELLQYNTLHGDGKCVIKPFRDYLFYLRPKNKPNYVKRKLWRLNKGEYKFCCFNSVEEASPEDFAEITSWIKNRLNINF